MTYNPQPHPILRHRKRNDGFEAWEVPYVVIGRLSSDSVDEVWTRSRTIWRKLMETLDCRNGWGDVWGDAALGRRGFRPYLNRDQGSRLLCIPILATKEHSYGPCMSREDWEAGSGRIADRVFDLLVQDRVLKNPPAKLCRGVHGSNGLELKPDHLWMVDEKRRDEWIGVRRLLLTDV